MNDRELEDGPHRIPPAAHVVELRVDRFDRTTPEQVAGCVAMVRTAEKGVLLTVRSRDEGGEAVFDDDRRFELFSADHGADAYDLEIRSRDLWPRLRGLADQNGACLIGSFHDFAGTPPDEMLDTLCDEAYALGADICKIAWTPRGRHDLSRFLAFTARWKDRGIVTLGMGHWGPLSRLAAPAVGSLLSYGFVGEAVAPGQLSVEELKRQFDTWYPKE